MAVKQLSMTDAVTIMWSVRRDGVFPYAYPTFAAIGMAESRLNAHAMGLNDHDPAAVSYLSVDWGWLQINDYWQNMTIQECRAMFDPYKCANKALDIFLQGNKTAGRYGAGYDLWNSYKNGYHKPYMATALAAAREIGIPDV
jgi:hypothetical protein